MLALVIVCKWWMLLVLVTIGTLVWAGYKESKEPRGGYIPAPPIYLGFWIFGNLVMWLIYFIIV